MARVGLNKQNSLCIVPARGQAAAEEPDIMRRIIATAVLLAFSPAGGTVQAASDNYARVPELNVKQSCSDAEKFSSQGEQKGVAYKGCMQDEQAAKDQLAKRWSSFKSRDRLTCVEQARTPNPSYVEVLTCLEMNSGGMISNGRPTGPQIGGPLAPGLDKTNGPSTAPASPEAPK
jgi:hypothetical protein